MKRWMLLLTVFMGAGDVAVAQTTNDPTTEVLVLTTATLIPPRVGRTSIEIQNIGPNNIFCALASSSKAVVNKARRIGVNDAWAFDAPATMPVYCIAATASQVTGAATVVTQI